MVELIIAVLAIIVVTTIIATVVGVFTSPHMEEEYSISGFMALYTQLEQYEADRDMGDSFNIDIQMAGELVIVGFSPDDSQIARSCNLQSVVDEAEGWTNIGPFSKETAEIRLHKPETCMANRPCLCLCKQEFSDESISCEKAAVCLPFDEEHNKGIEFDGYEEEGVSCEIPLIYSQKGESIASYCVKRVEEGSDGGTWEFHPGNC